MSDDLYEGDESSPFLTHFIGRVNKGFWSNIFAESEGKTTGDFAHTTMWFSHVDVVDILQVNYDSSGPPIETITNSLGVGNGWQQSLDSPNLVEHDDDSETKRVKFRAGCAYMKVAYLVAGKIHEYEDAVVLDGDSERIDYDMTGVRAVHAKREINTLRDASLYDGCIFEYRGLGFKTRQNDKPRARPYPVRYLGYSEDEIVDLSSLSGVSGNSRTESREAGRPTLRSLPDAVLAGWQEAGASDPTISILTQLWEKSPTVDHFINNAGALPDVKANEALAKAVLEVPDTAAPDTASVPTE